MKARSTIFAVLFLLASAISSAQEQQDSWYFGERCHIQFSADVAHVITSQDDSPMLQTEGCAATSDPVTGKIIFYTDGRNVWNDMNQIVPNGTGLMGDVSSTQSALIVPMPGDATRYYIFTSTVAGADVSPGIRYSIYDVTRRDVVVKNVPVLSPAAEKLVGVCNTNRKDFWVIAHAWGEQKFCAFPVTSAGVGGAIVSRIGSPQLREGAGYLKSSIDGTKLACAVAGTPLLELLSFDATTGRISGAIDLPTEGQAYGVSFSPDNRLLYATSLGSGPGLPSYLYQYDVSSGNAATIAASAQVIARSERTYGGLQIAPNGRIYMAVDHAPHLGVIACPNNLGPACRFSEIDPTFLLTGNSRLGVPNMIDGLVPIPLVECVPPKAAFVASTLTVCLGDSVDFTDKSVGATMWYWSFANAVPSGSAEQNPHGIRFISPGSATVTLIISSEEGSDTTRKIVHVLAPPVANAGPDQTICTSGSVQLSASGGVSYEWSPAEGLNCTRCRQPIATPTKTTTYYVLVTDANGCHAVDSVTITIGGSLTVDAGTAPILCPGDSVQLTASGADTYNWSPAVGLSCSDCRSPWAHPATTTTYTLLEKQGECSGTDTVTVFVGAEPQNISAGADIEICAGGSGQLGVTGGIRYSWSPTEGLSCTDCAAPTASPAVTTRYVVTGFNETGCSARDTVVVKVLPPLDLEIAPVTPICRGDSIDLTAQVAPGATIAWSPAEGLSCADCAAPRAFPLSTTTYTATMTSSGGCISSSSVTVTVLDPPAADAGPDRTTCLGTPVRIGTPGALTYRWEPAEGLDCRTCAQPLATPRATTTYHLTASNQAGCSAVDSVTITVMPKGVLARSRDTAICPGESVLITASGAESYLWSPQEEIECPTCASTIVHPARSITYVVDAVDANGCRLRDSVHVTLREAVPVHIPRDLRAKPGATITVPIILDDPVTGADVRQIHIRLRLPTSLLLYRGARTGDATAGWSVQATKAPDGADVTLSAPTGISLSSAGTLLLVDCATFVGDSMESELQFDLDFGRTACPAVIATAGHVTLDSICGLSMRLIGLTAAKYAMLGVQPNPFNPSARISFSLGLDGETSVSVVDAAGHLVTTLLEDYLESGEHGITWDATQYPSGLYFYRIESGAWHAGGALLLVK